MWQAGKLSIVSRKGWMTAVNEQNTSAWLRAKGAQAALCPRQQGGDLTSMCRSHSYSLCSHILSMLLLKRLMLYTYKHIIIKLLFDSICKSWNDYSATSYDKELLLSCVRINIYKSLQWSWFSTQLTMMTCGIFLLHDNSLHSSYIGRTQPPYDTNWQDWITWANHQDWSNNSYLSP